MRSLTQLYALFDERADSILRISRHTGISPDKLVDTNIPPMHKSEMCMLFDDQRFQPYYGQETFATASKRMCTFLLHKALCKGINRLLPSLQVTAQVTGQVNEHKEGEKPKGPR